MSEDVSLSPAASRALAQLSRAFLAAARTWALYPTEHPIVRASVGRFQTALCGAADVDVVSAIAVTPTTLMVSGAIPSRDSAIEDLAAMLHARGILEVGFDAVVPPEAVEKLLAFLARLAAGTLDVKEGIREAWAEQGHAAIRLEAIDYAKVLEDHETSPLADRDDVWRSIVAALRAGRRSLDEQEQKRLLEMAEDPGALAVLAGTLIAEKCTPDGSPMMTTQAETVLTCFRHLASIASVLAPERTQQIMKNLAAALLRVDPHVGMEMLSLDRGRAGSGGPGIGAGLGEDGVAQLLASVVLMEGRASSRLAEIFELLIPERDGRRRVLDRARALAQAQHTEGPFDAFWSSVEELLLSYNDDQFVSDDYRTVLDGAKSSAASGPGVAMPELGEWAATVTDDSVQRLSMVLLCDLLRLEDRPDRAVIVLNQLSELVEDLLLAGQMADALRMLGVIEAASNRDDLATPVAQVLQRLGGGEAVRETAGSIGELDDEEWKLLADCYNAIGASCLIALKDCLATDRETLAARRVTAVFAAMGPESIEILEAILRTGTVAARIRVAKLLGQIGSPLGVPALAVLLRSVDPRILNAAIGALAAIDDPAASRSIHTALCATDGRRRQMVVDALVEAGDRRVVPMLVRVLDACRPLAADYDATIHTLDALERLKDPTAVSSVARVMFLSSWFSRRRLRALKTAAIRALAAIDDPSSAQALARGARVGDRMLKRLLKDVPQSVERVTCPN